MTIGRPQQRIDRAPVRRTVSATATVTPPPSAVPEKKPKRRPLERTNRSGIYLFLQDEDNHEIAVVRYKDGRWSLVGRPSGFTTFAADFGHDYMRFNTAIRLGHLNWATRSNDTSGTAYSLANAPDPPNTWADVTPASGSPSPQSSITQAPDGSFYAAAYNHPSIWKSTDGSSFSEVLDLTGLAAYVYPLSIAAHPTDANKMAVVGLTASGFTPDEGIGVLYTTDGWATASAVSIVPGLLGVDEFASVGFLGDVPFMCQWLTDGRFVIMDVFEDLDTSDASLIVGIADSPAGPYSYQVISAEGYAAYEGSVGGLVGQASIVPSAADKFFVLSSPNPDYAANRARIFMATDPADSWTELADPNFASSQQIASAAYDRMVDTLFVAAATPNSVMVKKMVHPRVGATWQDATQNLFDLIGTTSLRNYMAMGAWAIVKP